ncbi:Tll0287-like domain-containing protein [Arcobacter arenosus]|uniref:DUF3365 domain-containing protein n=1 Tax=Arcobacter arenosus TaxID=2576037 RepID=A0A5R8Y498_9BACT|nr:DUF3365 domain-containing protein [Arcobacter arenosus]TLP40610.1 DUF3365 domain-containing protein [Arcobacter arenosus]
MQTIVKLITFTIGVTLVFSACSNNQPTEISKNNFEEKEMKKEALDAIKVVGGAFQKTLSSKISNGGLPNAATFCSTNSHDLAQEVFKTLPQGISLKRITSKPRNPNNKASKEELLVLNQLKNNFEKNQSLDMIVKQKSPNHYQVYKPIKVDAICLKCHGTNTIRDEKAYDIILKMYPTDKAIGYALNDFRGAFLVDIIK